MNRSKDIQCKKLLYRKLEEFGKIKKVDPFILIRVKKSKTESSVEPYVAKQLLKDFENYREQKNKN